MEAVEVTEEEERRFLERMVEDQNERDLAKSFADFKIPSKEEGFQDIVFAWQGEEGSAEYLKRWIADKKLVERVPDLRPNEWFREKLRQWQQTLSRWKRKQEDWSDPSARRKPKPVGPVRSEGQPENSDEVDPWKLLDVTDIGTGEPLFSKFTWEDWQLLELRVQLHLLVHGYKHAMQDPERVTFHESHTEFYYEIFYRRPIDLRNFGAGKLSDLLEMVKDTLEIFPKTSVLDPQLSDDTPFENFLRLVEDARRCRLVRLDGGDETARLRLTRAHGRAAPPRQRQEFRGDDRKGDRGKGDWGDRGKGDRGKGRGYDREPVRHGGRPQHSTRWEHSAPPRGSRGLAAADAGPRGGYERSRSGRRDPRTEAGADGETRQRTRTGALTRPRRRATRHHERPTRAMGRGEGAEVGARGREGSKMLPIKKELLMLPPPSKYQLRTGQIAHAAIAEKGRELERPWMVETKGFQWSASQASMACVPGGPDVGSARGGSSSPRTGTRRTACDLHSLAGAMALEHPSVEGGSVLGVSKVHPEASKKVLHSLFSRCSAAQGRQASFSVVRVQLESSESGADLLWNAPHVEHWGIFMCGAFAPPKVKAVLKARNGGFQRFLARVAEPKTKWKGRAGERMGGTKVRMDQWKKSLKGCWLETLVLRVGSPCCSADKDLANVKYMKSMPFFDLCCALMEQLDTFFKKDSTIACMAIITLMESNDPMLGTISGPRAWPRFEEMAAVDEEFDFDEVNLEPTERVEVDGDNVDESWEVGDDILDVAQLEIDTENFGELRLTETAITKVQAGLKLLIETVGSVEAAGDAIYSTLFEAAPSLQSLFKTPRAVQGMKFAMSIANIVAKLRQPDEVKTIVDQLSFQHITTEVTIPRILAAV
ncbi:Heterogeneous nuclear ribonucleoprotein U [Durusdinium trenchii]|uniref:Heterogeneous nuclear ribonucleoprotein U n=1 Tax=Durusdinium trenchii TaxID=1381693 RepID=A0ABP0H7G5_9DINO